MSTSKKPATAARTADVDLGRAVVETFLVNERMNQFLLEHLDPSVWTAPPPLAKEGAGQDDRRHRGARAQRAAHVARRVGEGDEGAGQGRPEEAHDPRGEARARGEREGSARILERSIEAGGKVKEFKPDVVGFLGYVVSHEAHHRGQIAMIARQLGKPLPQEANFGMWDWAKRWKEIAV
jgi:hypothetical protein